MVYITLSDRSLSLSDWNWTFSGLELFKPMVFDRYEIPLIFYIALT